MRSSKPKRLAALAAKRQQSRWHGYGNLADYHDGQLECDFVSPYTKSCGNVDSPIFAMLQDWQSHDALVASPPDAETVRLGYMPSLRTNRVLEDLLGEYFGKVAD